MTTIVKQFNHQAGSTIDAILGRVEGLVHGIITPPHIDCDKPYDSEWEMNFEWVLAKYLADGLTLTNQEPFCDRYRCDFAIKCNETGKVWIVEYDGKTFHDEVKDRIRDGRIFKHHNEVQSITRVAAITGQYEPEITRDILKRLLPDCFCQIRDYPVQPEWELTGDTYTARVFDNRGDGDCWADESGGYRDGAPHTNLEIIHRTNAP